MRLNKMSDLDMRMKGYYSRDSEMAAAHDASEKDRSRKEEAMKVLNADKSIPWEEYKRRRDEINKMGGRSRKRKTRKTRKTRKHSK